MRFGICADMGALPQAVKAGADYIECRVTELNGKTDAELAAFMDGLAAIGIKCEALAVLFPGGDIPLVGERADFAAIEKYLRDTFKRLSEYISPEIIVFGSGGARKCPEGFDQRRAFSQLAEVGRLAADAASPYGITIALEPLNRKETNMINSLGEALELVKTVSRDNFKIIADIYHILTEDEPPKAILACGGYIVHTHIATKEGRRFPHEGNRAEFAGYFNALREIGYDGRMSIEAGGDLDSELAVAMKYLKRIG
jgi:sugar phosphate isomerase/epimerase